MQSLNSSELTIKSHSISKGRSEQFMAGEEDFAEFIRPTLSKLQNTGATGAVLWYYADYIPEVSG